MKHRWWLGIVVVVTFVLTACSQPAEPTSPPATGDNPATTASTPAGNAPAPAPAPSRETPDQIRTPHFVDSYPIHGDVFRQPPEAIVINFNFDLHKDSSIAVRKDGTPVPVGTTTIDPDGLTMRAPLEVKAGDGLYLVTYTACWPDGSCHDGQFAFHVDSKLAGYVDLTGREVVAIDMQGLKFEPTNIIISKGTKVTWTNREGAVHFVNTDPHPSHNVLPDLNSRSIGQGESYSFTFSESGEWGYHCSAHYPQGMTGHVIVLG